MRESTVFSISSTIIGAVLLSLVPTLKQDWFLCGTACVSGLVILGVGIVMALPLSRKGTCPVCGTSLERSGACPLCAAQVTPGIISRRFWKVLP